MDDPAKAKLEIEFPDGFDEFEWEAGTKHWPLLGYW